MLAEKGPLLDDGSLQWKQKCQRRATTRRRHLLFRLAVLSSLFVGVGLGLLVLKSCCLSILPSDPTSRADALLRRSPVIGSFPSQRNDTRMLKRAAFTPLTDRRAYRLADLGARILCESSGPDRPAQTNKRQGRLKSVPDELTDELEQVRWTFLGFAKADQAASSGVRLRSSNEFESTAVLTDWTQPSTCRVLRTQATQRTTLAISRQRRGASATRSSRLT